ncbi:MAG: hypothetical protein U0T02_11740 [Solirubrobacteraceae bacterium]
MTTKADYTDDEWTAIRIAPLSAGMIVVTAQGGGTLRETYSMAKAYAEAREQHGASELLDAIVSERPERDHHRYHSIDELRQGGLERVREAVAVLEAKATPAELGDYRAFVTGLATKVAEAHREDDAQDPVGDGEREAIGEIRAALGAPAG